MECSFIARSFTPRTATNHGKKMILYKKMTKKNNTIQDFGILPLKEGYTPKFRLKEFEVIHADGSCHRRGPCLSMQLFSPKTKFIQGRVISIDLCDLAKFIEKLSEIEELLNESNPIRNGLDE